MSTAAASTRWLILRLGVCGAFVAFRDSPAEGRRGAKAGASLSLISCLFMFFSGFFQVFFFLSFFEGRGGNKDLSFRIKSDVATSLGVGNKDTLRTDVVTQLRRTSV